MHDWPAWLNPATEILSAAVAPVAVGLDDHRRVVAQLEARPSCAAPRPRMPQPTSGEPVKVIMATSAWSTSALPTVAAAAGDDVELARRAARTRRAAGRPARWPTAASGWRGLSTTGQPAAIAGATLWATRLSGKLNGLMAPTTPIGTRSVKPSLPSPGVARVHAAPSRRRACGPRPPRSVNVSTARLGLDAGRLDRLGRLLGDDAGELLGPLGEQDGGAGRGPPPARPRRTARRRRPRRAGGPGRRRPPGRPRPRRTRDPAQLVAVVRRRHDLVAVTLVADAHGCHVGHWCTLGRTSDRIATSWHRAD